MHNTNVPGLKHILSGYCVCPCLLCTSTMQDKKTKVVTTFCICPDCIGGSCTKGISTTT